MSRRTFPYITAEECQRILHHPAPQECVNRWLFQQIGPTTAAAGALPSNIDPLLRDPALAITHPGLHSNCTRFPFSFRSFLHASLLLPPLRFLHYPGDTIPSADYCALLLRRTFFAMRSGAPRARGGDALSPEVRLSHQRPSMALLQVA